MCIIFYFIAIGYFIYKFIHFAGKENFTLQYYSMKLNETNKINFGKDKTAFAFALTNDNKKDDNLKDLLTIEVNFTNQKNKKNSKKIQFRPCKYSDLPIKYSEINSTLINITIQDLNCIDKQDLSEYEPEGIYTDDNFTYYEITIKLNSDNKASNLSYINEYLTKNDIKFQFYYTDISFDVTNKAYPFSPFIDSMFIQLNPTLIQKRNIFFLNYILTKESTDVLSPIRHSYFSYSQTGLSRIEDYALYKGLSERNMDDSKNRYLYAKIYIRADNQEV